MRIVTCQRCGRENEVSEEFIQLPKCPQCENIKFDRKEFFFPIEKKVIINFKKAKNSEFGPILNGLYLFGSYARKEAKCGDIDILVTYSEPKLKKFTNIEIEKFRSQFYHLDLEEYSQSELMSILKDIFWDFRICQEYPDCLVCYGGYNCKLPSADYHSSFHTYCLKRCKNKYKNAIANCCFIYCTFLNSEIRNHILNNLNKIIKEDIPEYYKISPKLKLKIIDIVWKRKIKELKDMFLSRNKNKKLQIFRINILNGKKTKVK